MIYMLEYYSPCPHKWAVSPEGGGVEYEKI
ncbi:hypothetical protein ABG79_02268 [Caloramator mitchellensis]|uniref:Uncharacterized protein n=1 Tax=Caloramator mitchellensis TaxID=908809 RepID=A0A0R3JYF1_CALMK|nr:hypothetical protein ABG79_02268 [Caloramator mitchellensis]